PSRSASRALRMVCAAQRNSVSGWKMVGRIEAMDLEPDAGTGGCVEQRLQPLDVGRLLDRMDEALIPQPGGTGRFGHRPSPSVNDARPSDRALRLIANGLRTSRQAPTVPRSDVTPSSRRRRGLGHARNERTLLGPNLAVTAPPLPPASICRRGEVAGT